MKRRSFLLTGFLLLGLTPAARAVVDPWERLPNPAEEKRAEQIGRQLRCLVCQNEDIEHSEASLAADLRRIIRRHVALGWSNRRIIAWMVKRYGTFVLLDPPFEPLTWLLWASPLLALAAGGATAVVAFRRQRASTPLAPLSEAEKARLSELLPP